MTIAEAFFDESGTNDDDKNLCLAGYIFEGEAGAAFAEEWRSLLDRYGLPFFHMREFRQQGKGVFRNLSTEQREGSLAEAIEIIQRHAARGFAFSVEKRSFDEVVRNSPWSREYSFLANQTFYGIEQMFEGREAGPVNYIFEHGAQGWGQAEAVFADAKRQPELSAQYRLGEFRRLTKVEAVQLQAADLLVWSTLRDRRRVDAGEKPGRHTEFKRLLGVPLDVHHWDAAAGEMIQWVKQVGGNDPDFLRWLTRGATPRFLFWLTAAGPQALEYFKALFKNTR
jgi:hypothetical protein